MGRKSQERMTGRTLEERISNPTNMNNTVDVLKEQKKINKQNKAIRRFMSMLYKTGRIGKVK